MVNLLWSCWRASRLADMSSRTAACGQPPVSIALWEPSSQRVLRDALPRCKLLIESVSGAREDVLDAGRWESGVLGEELGVFAREDVVCYCCYAVFGAEGEAEGEHEGCFAGTDRAVGGALSAKVPSVCG